MSLKINNLSKRFKTLEGEKTVLKGLSLEVKPGEIFALLGANGSGKTTLLKTIATLILPDTGQIYVSGINTAEFPHKARAKTGLACGADTGFYQMLSAEENIRFFAKLYGSQHEQNEEYLAGLFERLGLMDCKKTKFSHLSSGMKQKLAFLRAALIKPEVLLVDEVSRSLDEEAEKKLSLFLKETVLKLNAACVVVTHDKNWALEFSARAGVLVNGAIEALQ